MNKVVCTAREFRKRKCIKLLRRVARAYLNETPRPSKDRLAYTLTKHRPFGVAMEKEYMAIYESEISKVFGKILKKKGTPDHIRNFGIT